jgi:hypothetical protein
MANNSTPLRKFCGDITKHTFGHAAGEAIVTSFAVAVGVLIGSSTASVILRNEESPTSQCFPIQRTAALGSRHLA